MLVSQITLNDFNSIKLKKYEEIKKMRLFLAMFIMLFAKGAFAEIVNCGQVSFSVISIQGDREGTNGHENKLILELSKNDNIFRCAGKAYVYLENTDQAFDGILAAVLAANAQNVELEVWVNSSNVVAGNASEIAWVSFKN